MKRNPQVLRELKCRDGRAFTAAVFAIPLVLYGQHAMAQTSAGADVKQDETLIEIVVTAQKREESLQKVPISIAVLSGAALDKQVAGGSLAALAVVPGIGQTTADTGGMTQLSMRGVAPAGYFGSGTATVAYYLDSVPFQFVRNAIVPNAKGYDMARVEVLRGPQGTLYGASALNGVVRVLTNDANVSRSEFKARGGVSFTEGGEPSYRADAAANVPLIEDKLAIRVVAGAERLGGWIEQPVRGVGNANSSKSDMLRLKLAAAPTENLRIDLGAWFERDHYDGADYADELGNQYTPLEQPGTTEFDIYSAKISYDLPAVSITSSTSYLEFGQRMKSDGSYINPNFRPFIQGSFSLPAHVFSEEMLFNSTGDGPWRWSLGLFYRDAEDDRRQTLPPLLVGTLYWKEFSESHAVFGQVTRAFADDRFELSAGLRYFSQEGRTEVPVIPNAALDPGTTKVSSNKVTPRVVATWLPNDSFTMYASYAQGFRAGLNQMPLTLRVAPIPEVKSDTLHNYEVGAKGTLLDGTIAFDLAVYYIKWRDAQSSVGILYGPPGAQGQVAGLVNGPSASGLGTDWGVSVSPGGGFQFGGNMSLNALEWDGNVLDRGEVLYFKGDQLAFSPRFSAQAHASYTFTLTNWLDAMFKVSGDYRSKMIQRVSGGGASTLTGCGLGGNNTLCSSGSPLYIGANFDLISASGKTLSLYGTNLNNWDGLLQPSITQNTPFRARPRTIGVQFEAKF